MRQIVLALSILGAVSTGAAAANDYDCAYDPKATHISRFVAADSTAGPVYGAALNDPEDKSHARTLNLRDHELVLTFDDGPLGNNTRSVLDTLQKHCVKATFFSVGKMAQGDPKLLQEMERRGHTIGAHTYSHPRAMHEMPIEEIKLEVEKGFAAVSQAVGKPIAPFFRFPGLRDSKGAVNYLASRNISVWSVDVISGDADPGATAERVTHDVLNRIHYAGKGIVLFHDIKRHTAEALDGILTNLEKDGYKFVHAVSNTYYQPDPALVARVRSFPGTTEVAAANGNVDVMHTEWIDLQLANDRLTGAAPAAPAVPGQRSDAGQPGMFYTANGWKAAQGQVH